MELSERFIETNGVRLHVVESGPTLGVPVVLLHGFPEFWYGWRKQIPTLSKAGYRVIVPDQRGYNISDKPRGVKAYKMQELVKDIIGLINALDYEKVNLVGHDWGAMVAWALAIWNPECLHRLGILNAPHPQVLRRFLLHDLDQIRRSWYVFSFQIPRLPERSLAANNMRGLTYALRASGRLHTFGVEEIGEYKKAWSQPETLTAMVNWYRAIFRFRPDISKDARVRTPTLMLWGMKDVALTHRMARPSMDYCEDGRLILFPDATHWIQHEAPDDVNRLLIEFFKS